MKAAFCAATFRWASGFAAGVMLFFTFGVALRLFKVLPRSEAGAINLQLFPNYYVFLTASLLIAAISACLLARQSRWNMAAAILITIALLGVLVNAHVLGPMIMKALTPETVMTFKKLHGISMGVNLLSILTTLTASLCLRRQS